MARMIAVVAYLSALRLDGQRFEPVAPQIQSSTLTAGPLAHTLAFGFKRSRCPVAVPLLTEPAVGRNWATAHT